MAQAVRLRPSRRKEDVNDITPIALVGAGPGDPELLTIKALRLLGEADVVVYDRLVSPGVLALIPQGTARIYVGKESGRHTVCQSEINELLVRLALSGRRVVRLKGGDPNVFARAGEEAEYLATRGVGVEVVPGITAAAGCAAAIGVPFTHRGQATGVRFVTGHCRTDVPLDLNWDSLADPDTTLVIYMGLASLPEFSRRLVEAGLSPTTPAVAISNGTTPEQRTCYAPLVELPERARAAGLRSPVLSMVGRVVELAGLLNGGATGALTDAPVDQVHA